jgi:hypothetical protein
MRNLTLCLVVSCAAAVLGGQVSTAMGAPSSAAFPGAEQPISLRAPVGQQTLTPDVADESTICTLNGHNPHKSSHVPKTVNVIVEITCEPPPRTELRVTAGLIYEGSLIAEKGPDITFDSLVASENAAAPCEAGYYQGYIAWHITAAPGYEPPEQNGAGSIGKVVHIKKC